MFKTILRCLLLFLVRTGRAHGWLYQVIDRYGKYLYTGPLTRRLFSGQQIECDIRDHVQQQIYFFGGYEPTDANLFLSLLEPGMIVVDAGANVGFYTLLCAHRVGDSGQVHSFEPIPRNFKKLQDNIQRNKIKNVTLNRVALWNKEGEITFSLSKKNQHNAGGFSASRCEEAEEKHRCSMTTMDSYMRSQGLSRIDAIKMDIEGAELFALQGMQEILERHKPILFLEVCQETCGRMGYPTGDLWNYLKKFGYRPWLMGQTPRESGWINNFSGVHQKNLLLIAKSISQNRLVSWERKTVIRNFLKARSKAA